MKCFRLGVIALALISVALSAQSAPDPVGNWRAVFVGPIGPRPMMVDAITFSIQSTPEGLKGTARASNWPGDLEVSDLKLTGNRLTFTGTGTKGWSTSAGGSGMQYYCCPKLIFDGTIRGDEMSLMLTWTSTEYDGSDKAPLPMEAKRISK